MKTLKTGLLAALLAAGTIACGGSSGERGPIPPQEIRGQVVLTASITDAADFAGFELVLAFDDSFLVALQPLNANHDGSGLANGWLCDASLDGDEVTLSCANATEVSGPGEIATFALEYDDFVPDAGDFALACSFVDENGAPVAAGCDFDLAL